MDLTLLKNEILKQNIQSIIIGEDGRVIASDDLLVAISPGTSIMNNEGVFLGMNELIEELEIEEKFKLDCIEIEFYGRHSIYDFLIQRIDNEGQKRRYILLLHDLEDVYRKIIDLRQERNEAAMYADKLAAAHEKLKQTQLQLISKEKMASIGLLAAGMTHEINNPLNYIFNSTELIKRNLDDSLEENHFIKEMLSFIETGASRIKEVVNHLKVFDESGQDERKIIDVHDAIDHTLDLIKHHLKDNCIILKKYESEALQLNCMPGKFNQALFNIFHNAANFTSQIHEPKIEISTVLLEDHIHIYIKDNGIGIPENIGDKVFDPFFTTKKMGTGKGLGLSVSHIVIKEHKGILSFESEEGEGTTFCIKLPLID